MEQELNHDYFSKKNNNILFAVYKNNNYGSNTLRHMYVHNYVDYDTFVDFYLQISRDAIYFYPFGDGDEKYEFVDFNNGEIIINDNLLTEIKIFNLPKDFETTHLDDFISIFE